MAGASRVVIFMAVICSIKQLECNPNASLEVGDDCVLPDGAAGVCLVDHECPSFVASNGSARNRLFNSRCGFFGANDVAVCCPDRKSAQKCSLFGTRPSKPVMMMEDKIVAGQLAALHEIPQFAILFSKNEHLKLESVCGGVLISERFVLTAAHCLKEKEIEQVKLGYNSLLPDDGDSNMFDKADVRVKRQIPHEKYRTNVKNHDIGLIELDQAVKFSHSIWPACLPDDTTSYPTQTLQIAGFGLNSDRSSGGKASSTFHQPSNN